MTAANDTTIEGMMGGLPGVRQFGLNTNQAVDFSGAPSVALPGGTTIAGANNITSTSANAFTVGPNGTTNPMLQVDASAGSAATGLAILGKAAGSGIVLAAISSGTNEDLAFNTKATGKFRFSPGSNSTTAFQITKADGTTEIFKVDSTNASLIETSSNAAAFVVGPNGGTNPTFTIDASTASAATGLQVKSAAAGSGITLSAISSGSNESLYLAAKSAGVVGIPTATTSFQFGAGATTSDIAIVGESAFLGYNFSINGVTPTLALMLDTTNSVARLFLQTGGARAYTSLTFGVSADVFSISSSTITITEAKNIALGTTTGTQIGTGTTQKLSFYGVTPIVQPAASTDATSFVAGAGTASKSDSTWTGASGSSAYTVGGIVTRLKALGLLAA